MSNLMKTTVDISPDAVAALIGRLDVIFEEAAPDSPEEDAALDAMEIIEALRTALTASERLLREWVSHVDGNWMVSQSSLEALADRCRAQLAKGETK
jgi:hypothetical protein